MSCRSRYNCVVIFLKRNIFCIRERQLWSGNENVEIRYVNGRFVAETSDTLPGIPRQMVRASVSELLSSRLAGSSTFSLEASKCWAFFARSAQVAFNCKWIPCIERKYEYIQSPISRCFVTEPFLVCLGIYQSLPITSFSLSDYLQ